MKEPCNQGAEIDGVEMMNYELSTLTSKQQRKLLKKWNQTKRDYPVTTLHALFEAQVERVPDAEALVFGDTVLSYRQLNNRANQLAHYLRKLGVGPELLVGLCVERGLDMIVGILGILKAEGAYLPLDPGYPLERLHFMLHDARPPFVLAQGGLLEDTPEFQGKVLRAETVWSDVTGEPKENPMHRITPDSLAYVIYTSGTTGQPKGTLVEHRGLSNVATEQIRQFGAGPGSRVLQFSSPNFDASIFDIVMALASGATLVLASKDDLLPGPGLGRLLQEQAITILTIPPSVLNILPSLPLPDLKVINVAGEACSADLVSRWAPGRRFFNLYGPTECTIWSTTAECQPDTGAPPIGRPIANTKAYILDDNLEPVAIGEAGELFVSGVGIARGYLRRTELTAERFLPDPFDTDSLARMYRTGDRVRYQNDGNIQFLGRVDDQIKIRGFRVEPGEVEQTLRAYPRLHDVAVLAHQKAQGDLRLVAYIVPEKDVQVINEELHNFLRERLPDYMVPSRFMVMDALPLTLNGKLDRQALPVPDWNRSTADRDYEPPRTAVEKLLAGIFEEVLVVDNVGVHDNFFELGGHSLSASQLIARVRDIFNIELPIRSVFEIPDLGMLSSELEKLKSGERPPESFHIEPASPDEQLPLSYAQERIWFVRQLNTSSTAYNAQAALHWHGNLDVSALENSLTEIVRRHEILRTTFADDKGVPVQRIHAPHPVKLQIACLEPSEEDRREQQIDALVQQAFREPFDVIRLPLVRWTLIRVSDTEHIMTHVEHHIIHDGWSFNVFIGELSKLYKAYHEGKSSPLPEPEIQFSDFTRWQRLWMEGEEA